MPKNAQGSWVGTTAQPVFPTYRTAGQLAPTTTPTPLPSASVPTPTPPTPQPTSDRARLVGAIIGQQQTAAGIPIRYGRRRGTTYNL